MELTITLFKKLNLSAHKRQKINIYFSQDFKDAKVVRKHLLALVKLVGTLSCHKCDTPHKHVKNYLRHLQICEEEQGSTVSNFQQFWSLNTWLFLLEYYYINVRCNLIGRVDASQLRGCYLDAVWRHVPTHLRVVIRFVNTVV